MACIGIDASPNEDAIHLPGLVYARESTSSIVQRRNLKNICVLELGLSGFAIFAAHQAILASTTRSAHQPLSARCHEERIFLM